MIGQVRGLMQYFRLLNTYITFHFFDKFIAILYIFLEFKIYFLLYSSEVPRSPRLESSAKSSCQVNVIKPKDQERRLLNAEEKLKKGDIFAPDNPQTRLLDSYYHATTGWNSIHINVQSWPFSDLIEMTRLVNQVNPCSFILILPKYLYNV